MVFDCKKGLRLVKLLIHQWLYTGVPVIRESVKWLNNNRDQLSVSFLSFAVMREFNSNIRFEICICFINNNWYDVVSLSLINIEFLEIEVLLCHNPYCFSSQSQTVFQMGADCPQLFQFVLINRRKQLIFCDPTTSSTAKWGLRNDCRNSILMVLLSRSG